MICNVLNFKGNNFNYTDVKITLDRNIPVNMQEDAATVQQLNGIVSKKTLLSQLPFIENVDAELERLKEDDDYNMSGGEVNEQ